MKTADYPYGIGTNKPLFLKIEVGFFSDTNIFLKTAKLGKCSVSELIVSAVTEICGKLFFKYRLSKLKLEFLPINKVFCLNIEVVNRLPRSWRGFAAALPWRQILLFFNLSQTLWKIYQNFGVPWPRSQKIVVREASHSNRNPKPHLPDT